MWNARRTTEVAFLLPLFSADPGRLGGWLGGGLADWLADVLIFDAAFGRSSLPSSSLRSVGKGESPRCLRAHCCSRRKRYSSCCRRKSTLELSALMSFVSSALGEDAIVGLGSLAWLGALAGLGA